MVRWSQSSARSRASAVAVTLPGSAYESASSAGSAAAVAPGCAVASAGAGSRAQAEAASSAAADNSSRVLRMEGGSGTAGNRPSSVLRTPRCRWLANFRHGNHGAVPGICTPRHHREGTRVHAPTLRLLQALSCCLLLALPAAALARDGAAQATPTTIPQLTGDIAIDGVIDEGA